MKAKFFLLSLAVTLSMLACKEEEAREVTVTFLYGGGISIEQPVKEGDLIAPPSDAHPFENAQLIGWSKRRDTVEFWNFETDVVSKSITLSAYYHFPVIFDYQRKAISDTTWITDFIPATHPHAIAAPTTTPTVAKFALDGWYKEAACLLAWNFFYDKISIPTRLYAKWADAYTISYNTQGGSEISPSYVKPNTLLLRPEKPIRATNENLLFFGWYKESECANLWDFYRDTVTENTTLYARWYSIETSGMDFPIHMVTCEGKTIKVLKDDLPGDYTWTKDGEESEVHYNPCPEGWMVPTVSEMGCIESQLHTFTSNYDYWSREGVHDTWGNYFFGRCILVDRVNGFVSLGCSDFVNWQKRIRCVKYD